MKLEEFGDAKHPIGASGLPRLMCCDWCALMRVLKLTEDRGGVAANNGTATGRAIQLWHDSEGRRDLRDLLDQLKIEAFDGPKGGGHPFPDYEEAPVSLFTERYITDPRNSPRLVSVIDQEKRVTLQLPPHPLDQTRQPVHIVGHIDQVRVTIQTGHKSLWDLKTGRAGGGTMLDEFVFQQGAYVLGLDGVTPGGIIRLRDYTSKAALKLPPNHNVVFYPYQLGLDDFELLMEAVTLRVALLRMGEVTPNPGPWCNWCPAGGISECVRILRSQQ